MVKPIISAERALSISIHNAKACTLDGRDCWMCCLEDSSGHMILVGATGQFDPDSTSEHPTLQEAVDYAKDLGKRRGVTDFRVTGNITPEERSSAAYQEYLRDCVRLRNTKS